MSARARRSVRLGAGAGYSGDRIEPAVELAERAEIDYLVFECLAERTIALAQQERQRDPARGFDPFLEARMRAVLPACRRRGIRVVTNAGAANPIAAAAFVRELAASLGLEGLRVAAVLGDDVLHLAREGALRDTGGEPFAPPSDVLSANVYLGAEPIVEALAGGADVVITGRVADSSLFLAPVVHELGWRFDDWTRLARGAIAGHLLECAGQVTGGYFADPGYKDVDGLARLGFPIGEVMEDGSIVITKLPDSGGYVTARTCTEQLLYEVHDPSAYATPDVMADITGATVAEEGADRVRVVGVEGRERPRTLKVSVGHREGYVGEGQISYAGPGAVARARLALDVVAERLRGSSISYSELRLDLVGLNALHGDALSVGGEPYEVRVRVAARCDAACDARRIGEEVEALYTNGPAGGGGATKAMREIIAVVSAFVPREAVRTSIEWTEGRLMRMLRELAHSRTGDKGDTSNISLIAYESADYPLLVRYVTAERVREHFAGIVRGEVTRYELPRLGALNFVMEGALGGGVTRTLALDAHGKSLSSALLSMTIPDEDAP